MAEGLWQVALGLLLLFIGLGSAWLLCRGRGDR